MLLFPLYEFSLLFYCGYTHKKNNNLIRHAKKNTIMYHHRQTDTQNNVFIWVYIFFLK